jgi:glycosyltransferase involved in cell wall biosynthesis
MKFASAVEQGKAAVRSMILPQPQRRGGLPDPDEPLIIAGMFRTGNGLGRAARGCYHALRAEGLDPVAVDLSGLFNQAELAPAVPLGCLDDRRRGTLILFANPPEVERALMGLGLRRWQDWRIIGAWAWELPVAPPEWARLTRFVSEIWAPSRFVSDAFAAAYDRPVQTVPHHIAATQQMMAASDERPLQILTLADARSSLERKNPLAAIRMFQAAFPDQSATRLTVKCRNLDLFPDHARTLQDTIDADPRISLMDETLCDDSLGRLYGESDIVLSTHRSEGFGVHLAEAMAAGKCVIATGWSGNLEFMSDDSAVLLPYRLMPVRDSTGVYSPLDGAEWAEADFDAGVSALRLLASDPARRQALGERARRSVSQRLSPAAYWQALEAVPAG